MTAALIIFTLCTICWSLWIRRVTWSRSMEVAATLNIALQGAAVFLMSPWASRTIGAWLYGLTGLWNLEDLVAHDCYVVAASAIVYHLIIRLDQQHLARRFKLHIELPATLCLPIMLALFTFGEASQTRHDDFFRVATDWMLIGYWLVLCGTLTYQLLYGVYSLIPMWRDRPAIRGLCGAYMLAAGMGVAACVVRVGTAFLPGEMQDTAAASLPVWFLACSCGVGFAAISAHSWLEKNRLTGRVY